MCIRDSAEGIAEVGYESNGYGNYVKITHPDKTISYLAHLKRAIIGNRSTVKCEQVIGEVGTSGFSTGAHLHWGYKIPNGGAAGYKGYDDPLKYLQAPSKIATEHNPTSKDKVLSYYSVTAPYLNIRNSPESEQQQPNWTAIPRCHDQGN